MQGPRMQQDQNRRNDRIRQDLDVVPLSFAASSSRRGERHSGLDIMFDLHTYPRAVVS